MTRPRGDRRWREPRRGGRHFLGVDVGVVNDYTALCLLRRLAPNVLLPVSRDPDAVPWDADTNSPLELPEGVTLAQYLQPSYDVVDLQRTRDTSFEAIAREAQLTAGEVGDCTVCVDATGLGRGVVEEMRRIGMDVIGVTLGGGRRITGNAWNWNVPAATIYESVYQCFAQSRYRVAEALPHTRTLMGELQRCEVRRTESGHSRYGVWAGEDGHGDLLMALGLATVVAERHSVYRAAGGVVEARSVGPRDEGERTRPRGQSHRSTTRQLIDRMRELREAHHRATAGLSRPLGWP